MTGSQRITDFRRGASRRGITLMELLVVVGILLILVVLSARQVIPAMKQSRVRETARTMNIYLSGARNRAMATGRPCGVVFQRDGNLMEVATVFHQAEVPPSYSGDAVGTAVTMTTTGVGTASANVTGAFDASLVRQGDLMRINYQGYWYTITNVSGSSLTLTTDLGTGGRLPWPTSGQSLPLPFEILRQPVASAAGEFEAAKTTVVDLAFSGTETNPSLFAAGGSAPVTVMFSPNGSVQRVYVGNTHFIPTESIYFLVGRREQALSPLEPGLYRNWQDTRSLWVAISPQTGLVTSAEVSGGTGAAGVPADVIMSRQLAREAQTTGGR